MERAKDMIDRKNDTLRRKRVLFLIHDLGQGGAEKVLVNLVNHMDQTRFDISVLALFGGGVNEQFLAKHIRYRTVFPKMIPGNSHLMKLLSPRALHKLFIKEKYDIEVSYLEGPSARVISGCGDNVVKLACWIHIEQKSRDNISRAFRNYQEACLCYSRFRRIIFVSETVKEDFLALVPYSGATEILYNTIESDIVSEQSRESIGSELQEQAFHMVAVGSLKPSKGFDRLIRITKMLIDEGIPAQLLILGIGPEYDRLAGLAQALGISDQIRFLGYQTNPYRYVSKCDLFVCASFAEGFSTAATEALIVGTPVCTVDVSGMREMLGANSEYGLITQNSEEALFQGLKRLASDPALLAFYKKQAIARGKEFGTEKTVRAVEEMLLNL